MSDDKINIEDIGSQSEEEERVLFDELTNLQLSRRLEYYREYGITSKRRSRGILSKTDREYLLGLKEYENKQSEANRRQDIRNRIKNSLQDFKIIWPLMDKRDRDQVFDSLDRRTVDDSIEAMVSFIYLGLNQDVPRIEEAIRRGILAGKNIDTEAGARQVDISINVDYYPEVEDAKEKSENSPLINLTVEEIGVLAKAGELDPSQIKRMSDSYNHPPGYGITPHDEPRAKDAQGNEPKPPGGDFDPNIDNS